MFKKKKITVVIVLLFMLAPILSYAQKPSVMVVPADVYMNKNGYVEEVNNIDGSTMIVPDYEQLFLNDRYIRILITSISSAFQELDYPLLDFEAQLSRMSNRSVEMSLSENRTIESPRDIILAQAKADIILDVDYFVEEVMGSPSISFTINAIDSYTSTNVASVTQTGLTGGSTPLSVLVKEAVVQNMPAFEERLMNHFESIVEKGRRSIVEVTVSEDSWFDLFEFFGNGANEDELSFILRDLIQENTMDGNYRLSSDTPTLMIFEDVYVPLYDENGRQQDVTYWLSRNIMRPLRQDYGLDVTRETVGISSVRLVIKGER